MARHLDVCAECRNDLAVLERLGAEAADAAIDPPPVEQSLARTFARIDDWERSRKPTLRARAAAFFDALGDLIKTGPTNTNVNDVYVLLAGPPSRTPD